MIIILKFSTLFIDKQNDKKNIQKLDRSVKEG